ncbi:hypothetical protein [Peptostreptococcus sp. D1]|uniref:hypothetical protein n=1 Tax=Peptostreptococcus sp. D1 TaxID=72304 RepID=UPI0008EEDA21|nr:hypothetical protein [Peptostreptococcus sp. D1]SFE92544.1 hypothetical protein SAMN02910278_02087 [Peptostreptococcus sp. D1]
MRSITVNWNQVEWETWKAYLVKLPRSDYKFWVAKSHTQETHNGKQLRLLIRDDFEYKIFKQTKTTKTEEIISSVELLEIFGYVFDENIDVLEELKDE